MAYTGPLRKEKGEQLHLEDVTRETFDSFVDWLYLRNFPGQNKSEDELPDRDKDGEEHGSFLNSHELTKIYIFAVRYHIPDLQRDTIDTMFAYFERTKEIPTAETIMMAFESLPDTSLLRKLLVHQYCESKSDVTPEDELLWTHEILHDVLERYRYIIRMLKASFDPFFCESHRYVSKNEKKACRRSLKACFAPDLCDYHDHANREERSKCRKKRGLPEIRRF